MSTKHEAEEYGSYVQIEEVARRQGPEGKAFPRTRRRPLPLTRGSGSWHEIEENRGLTVLGHSLLRADDCIVLHVLGLLLTFRKRGRARVGCW